MVWLKKPQYVKNLEKGWRAGRTGELLAFAIAYIVCRKNNKPLTVLDLAVRHRAGYFFLLTKGCCTRKCIHTRENLQATV